MARDEDKQELIRTGFAQAQRIVELKAEVRRYRIALEEALPECWDTPKAERIIREALGGE